jgi:CO dehydrogenase/acetyl-CoA synthase alpha subunit
LVCIGEDLYRHNLLSNPIDLSIKYLKWNEISMEGKDKLSDSNLDKLVDKFKNKKDRYIML